MLQQSEISYLNPQQWVKTGTILQIACLQEEADQRKVSDLGAKTGLEVGLQRGRGQNKKKNAKIRKKIVTFAPISTQLIFWYGGVGVVIHLHHNFC